MKHAIIIDKPDDSNNNWIEPRLTKDGMIFLSEVEYTQEELDAFNAEAKNWILRCSGSCVFQAETDSGEDAEGEYCQYFDLNPETAIFENGKFVGVYVCCVDFNYSGNSRGGFRINKWLFHDPFYEKLKKYDRWEYWVSITRVALFAQEETHSWWNEWTLLKRDPDVEYKSYLQF